MSDLCGAAAEDLERLVSSDKRDKRRYVRRVLDEPNPSPTHLIGRHYYAFKERNGPCPDWFGDS